MLRDGDGFSSRITFLLSGMRLFIRRGAGAAVREVDPMNVVEELLMPHPRRSDSRTGLLGNTFTVTPEDYSHFRG